MRQTTSKGFTLIELSIVLVIIGLVIGGALVGQDLINAAAIRAQISQIEKYNTAVHTFQGKYGYLPGDMPQAPARQFGFTSRVAGCCSGIGQGDGNGLIIGNDNSGYSYDGSVLSGGESLMFWQDLSTAGLIDNGFSLLANTSTQPNPSTAVAIGKYLPAANIGGGNGGGINYIYVWSGGWLMVSNQNATDNSNYFGLSAIKVLNGYWGSPTAYAGLTVAQAYAIDKKIDDGLPQYGNVLALHLGIWGGNSSWASGIGNGGDTYNAFLGFGDSINGAPVYSGSGVNTNPQTTTCYDTSGGRGVEQYSMEQRNGAGVNCALSFKFQ